MSTLYEFEKKTRRLKRYFKTNSNTEIRIGIHNGKSVKSKGFYFDEDNNSIVIF